MRAHPEFCSVQNCGRRFYAKGYCRTHYARVRNGGQADRPIGQGKADVFIERLFSSAPTDECIIWPFAVGSKGYGVYRDTSAHRYVCRRAHGEPPADKPLVAHKCNVRKCVNQRHLRWASNAENEDDKRAAGTFYDRWTTIPDEKVRKIRALAGTMKYRDLAASVGASKSQTWRIAKCKSRLDPSLF